MHIVAGLGGVQLFNNDNKNNNLGIVAKCQTFYLSFCSLPRYVAKPSNSDADHDAGPTTSFSRDAASLEAQQKVTWCRVASLWPPGAPWCTKVEVVVPDESSLLPVTFYCMLSLWS